MLVTIGALIMALRSARVQTAAMAVLTDELSRALHVNAHIDQVDIRPPLAMNLNGVFLSDQQGDTLLSVPQLKVRFNPFALEENRLCFPLIKLVEPTICLKQDSFSTNIDFLVRAFSSNSPKQTFSYGIELRKIVLDKARVRYVHSPSHTDVLLTDIHSDIGFLFAGKDSVDAALRMLHVRAKLKGLDGYLDADFHGSLDTLYADRLKVVYHQHQIFDGNVCVQHLLQRDSLYAKFQCTDLSANAPLVSSLLSDLDQQPVQLPQMFTQLGTIHYRGSVEGRLNNLKLHGAFLTHIGSISTNVRLINLKEAHGQIRTTNLSLDRWLQNSTLGRLTASINIDGHLYDSLPNVKVDGLVSRLDFKGYTYSNIRLKADLNQKEELTSLSVDDPNLQVQLISHLDNWTTKSPTLYMDIKAPNIDLSALHLADSTLDQAVAFTSTVYLQVDSTIPNLVDGTVGTVRCDSIRMRGAGHKLEVPQLAVVVTADSLERHMSIESSLLCADIRGHFQWTSIPATIHGFIHRSLPSLTPAPVGHTYTNDMDFHAELLQANDLLRVLGQKSVVFPSVPSITGFVHESDSSFAIRVWSDEVINANTSYHDMYLSLDNDNPQRNATASFFIMQHIIEDDSTHLRIGDLMAGMQLIAHNDSITTGFEFGPVEKADSIPDLLIETVVSQLDKAPCVDVHFLPSDFQMGQALWHVDDAHVNFSAADTSLVFHNLRFYTPHQLLSVDGCMSPRLSDSVKVALRDIDLGYLLSSTKILDAVEFSGLISGGGTLYSAFSNPQFEANLTMENAKINHTSLGRVCAKAELDKEKKEVLISGSAVEDSVQLANVSGRVTNDGYWEVFVDANGMPLDFVNFWTKGIVEQIEGKAFGRVHIFGRGMLTWVTARAYAQDAAITIPYTGGRYFFSDSIILDTTYIDFPAIHLHDVDGHQGFFSGRINHEYFLRFNYQLHVKCDRLLALDLPASSGSMYYGRAYATGDVDISGNDWETRIDVNAATAGNTDFYLSLATASNASSTEFITFRQHDTVSVDSTNLQAFKPKSRFLFNLAIDAKPDAKIHLVLNEHNGDGIIGRGEGSIRLSLDDATGKAQMLGTYSLLNGTFSYTVANLIHRDFTIAEGSTVSWSGDPANPMLDITARYRCTASLRDLFGADVKQITSRPSIPVDCVIRVTDLMNKMNLKFGIEFPQSDETVSAQINSVINTEAMLMRQVVYLLVFNRFYTPDNMRTANTGLNDAYSLLSSTVTGQINSWLSKLTSMVNVGFNMRANLEQGNQSYETEANIQIQPVDRLTINGNVGYRYNDISNQPIFGDADVEYELTPDGKLRAKAFTHSVDKYSLHQTGMQSGIGFIFRHDFNPGDAKKRREQKKLEKK